MGVQLEDLARLSQSGVARGVTSVCSAHPLVLRAALRFGASHDSTVLIEATCNQVNHLGGYTGLKPADFAQLVLGIAQDEGCSTAQVILGGDHLGPNPWRSQTVDEAMAEACSMVASYVAAGFRKLHLDASMGCRGEPDALDDETTARRAARLAQVAEDTARRTGCSLPVYVIGTEVPPPGGADHVIAGIAPTSAAAARHTLAVHRRVFGESGLSDAFTRAIGLVVQPGVEFGNHNVISYDRRKAASLSGVLKDERQFVFEAHSTDYQSGEGLRALVEDGFPILKVGPELTFRLREALYGLDHVASALVDGYGERPLFQTMERVMAERPQDWARHYQGTAFEMRQLRHFSLSDRIRYYWPLPDAMSAVDRLFACLRGRLVPLPLLSQYLPSAIDCAGRPLEPDAIVIDHVSRSLATYHAACHPA